MNEINILRAHLLALLEGGQAYESFEDVAASIPENDRNTIPDGAEHSAWQIINHMARTLEDIIEYSNSEKHGYKVRDWPADYWSTDKRGNWKDAIARYMTAREKMEQIINDETRDLFATIPSSDGHTLLREVLLACDHQAYHIGELVELQRWLVARA